MFQLNGVVNALLGAVGLDALAHRLARAASTTRSARVLIVIVWREVGFGIVLFLARLLTLDEEPARGRAHRRRRAGGSALRYVILPELRGTIEFYVVVASITMLAWVFGYVYTLTKGGPGDATIGARALHLQPGPAQLDCPAWRRRSRCMLLGATMVFIALLFWSARAAASGRERAEAARGAPRGATRPRRRAGATAPRAVARHALLIGRRCSRSTRCSFML